MNFTETSTQILRANVETTIEEITSIIYTNKIQDMQQMVEDIFSATYKQIITLGRQLGEKKFDAKRPHDTVIKHIVANFEKGDRDAAYKYAALTRRLATIGMIKHSKVKLRKVAKETLANLIRAELSTKPGRGVTLSQIISGCTLKSDDIKSGTLIVHHKKGNKIEEVEVDSISWELGELKLQFVAELCGMDLMDLKVSDHTHVGEVPTKLANIIPKQLWTKLWQASQLLQKKTIFTEIPQFDPCDYVTRSSWYYRSPNPADAVCEVMGINNSNKYVFVPNALDLIEDAYIEHLKGDDDSMPDNWKSWVPERVKFFKEQIRASQANGGHYILWKMDSANRMYAQAEIGHLQTSAPLRKLVRMAGVTKPVKYDFRNNVVQMYSLLMKTKGLAKYVYLVDESERAGDLRQLIATEMNSLCKVKVFNKNNIKPLFMVWAYNAGKNRILDGVIKEDLGLFGLSYSTVKVEGLVALAGVANTDKNRDILWDAFHSTVVKLAPEIVHVKAVFKQLIKNNPLTETQWTMPDGAIAQYASAQTLFHTMHFIDINGKQHQHTHYIKQLVTNAKATGLLPRVIHSFDAWVARQLVIRAAKLGIDVVPNHDSFTFDEQYEDTIIELANELFLELLESEWFSSVLAELNISRKPLGITSSNGIPVTNEYIWDKYGKLEFNDLLNAEPLELED